MKRVAPVTPMSRPRGGVLTVISLLMIGSAALRLGFEAGPALARGIESDEIQSPDQTNGSNKEEMRVLLSELLQRKEELDAREDKVRDMERAIDVAERAIESRLAALQQAETSLRETLVIAETAAENDLTQLTDVYQNMKPKDASALFETMDPVFAAGFLSRMPPDAAAQVMAGLSPEAAYTVSVVMAGRNAGAPQE